MFKLMKKRLKNEKGLSLVELLAVIVILAIVAAIAIPAIGNIINNSRDKGQISEALSIIAGAKLAHIETGCGDNTTTYPNGCTTDKLADHVDGLPDDTTIQVKLTGDGWTISNYAWDLKKSTLVTTSAVTEDALRTELDTLNK